MMRLKTVTSVVLFAMACISSISLTEAAPLSDEIDYDAPVDPTVILALPGKAFPLNFADGQFEVFSVPVFVKEKPNTGLGTGLTVWDGAVVLSKYLEYSGLPISGKSVLEVGAGTGLVGVVASVLGASHVVLTDLDYCLANLQETVEANKPNLKGRVETKELDWFSPEEFWGNNDTSSSADAAAGAGAVEERGGAGGAAAIPAAPSSLSTTSSASVPDIILGADVVWVDSLIAPLVRTLKVLTDRPARKAIPVPGLKELLIAPTALQRKQGAAVWVDGSIAAASEAAGATASSSSSFSLSSSPPSEGPSSALPELVAKSLLGRGQGLDRTTGSNSALSGMPAVGSGSSSSMIAERSKGRPSVLLAHQTRSRAGDAQLLSLAAEAGFAVYRLSTAHHHPSYSNRDIHILEFVRVD